MSQANMVLGKKELAASDPTQSVYIITTPHLRVAKGIFRKLVVHQGYNNMVKYLARQPWESWKIPPGGLLEWHCQYNI